MIRLLPVFAILLSAATAHAEWVDLLKNGLEDWEQIGDGVWGVMSDGTLVGDRRPKESREQSWLYTRRNDYAEFDLQFEYWTRLGGNSGVSIRDSTRARYAMPPDHDSKRTPANNGYEIQIVNGTGGKYPSGSIYLFAPAARNLNKPLDWNLLEIESRTESIRVRLNGELVAEHPGDPARSKTGPIGLQLHDPNSVVMFRNIRLRETGR
jgi:hypothetical protein